MKLADAYKQILLTVSASLGLMAIGLSKGWPSTAIPSMETRDAYLIPDEESVSWVSAVPGITAVIGSLCAGPLLQHLGRKKSLLVSGPLFVIGWVILGTGRTFYLLIISRLSIGFCTGIIQLSVVLYVSECSFPEIRGILASLPALFKAIGVLLSYVLGTWLEWDQLAYVSAIPPALMLLLLMFLPESPVWLRNNNRHNEADRVLEWLNRKGVKGNISSEVYVTSCLPMEDIEDRSDKPTLPSSRIHPIASAKGLLKGPYSLEVLMRRSVLIPFGMVVAIMMFQQLSGINTIILYTVSIFKDSGSTVDEYTATIIVGVVQFVGVFLSLFIIDRIGRKPLLLVSGFLMFLSMSTLGAYFHFKDTNPTTTSEFGIVPLISLISFVAAFSIGYSNTPSVLMGELLPVAQRSFLSSVATAADPTYLVVKTYPDIKNIFGLEGVFFTYATFCLLSCIFVIAFLPETKHKTLEEIEEYFEKKHNHK